MMDDPDDVKPDDWDDEPATIPDPDAAKPDDWATAAKPSNDWATTAMSQFSSIR